MGEIKQEINWRFVADSLMSLANDRGELEAVKAERDRLKRHVGDLILDLNNARFDANVSASERDEPAQEVRRLENDNRIDAWCRLADHPFFKDCFESDDTLISAMLTKLDDATTGHVKPVYTSTPTCKENGEKFTRLTVADLDAAEVGSVLKLGPGASSTKGKNGWGLVGASAQQMLSRNPNRTLDWSTATLTPPEKSELPTYPDPDQHPVIMVHVGDNSGQPVHEKFAARDGDRYYRLINEDTALLCLHEVSSWSPARIVVEDGAG